MVCAGKLQIEQIDASVVLQDISLQPTAKKKDMSIHYII